MILKFFVILSKKTIASLLLITVAAFAVVSRISAINSCEKNGDTNAARVEYIKDLGYNINETAAEKKSIVIPSEFSDVYKRYNELQQSAGFDLSPYRGKAAEVYKYPLADGSDRSVTLIVCKDKIIGGDVCENAINGKMLPLKAMREIHAQKTGSDYSHLPKTS